MISLNNYRKFKQQLLYLGSISTIITTQEKQKKKNNNNNKISA
jgi:hypothetical protein